MFAQEFQTITGDLDVVTDSVPINGSDDPVIGPVEVINSSPVLSSPHRSVFPFCFDSSVISPRRVCATSLTMAQLAGTSLTNAEIEHRRIDEFGRDIHQQ